MLKDIKRTMRKKKRKGVELRNNEFVASKRIKYRIVKMGNFQLPFAGSHVIANGNGVNK